MISNKWELKLVKGALAVMQGLATFVVFYQANVHYHPVIAIILAISAVITVDGMILFCFSVLEDPNIAARDKHPWAMLTFLLVGAVFMIGYLEAKSILAFAPRLGLAALALGDIFVYWNQRHQEYNTREAQEQRIRDDMVIRRRESKQRAEHRALRALKKELKDRAILVMRRDLGLDEPLIVKRPEPAVAPKPKREGGKGEVIQLSSKRWGYPDPVTGEVKTTNAAGKPYTERGAKIALSRAQKQQESAQLDLFVGDDAAQ